MGRRPGDRQAGRDVRVASDDRRLRARRQRRRRLDHGNSHLTRTQLTLDPRGWRDVSHACVRLLDQVDRIEEAAKERVERNPHLGDTRDVALVMMLFKAARLAVETEGDPVVERRRRHRRPVTPSAAARCDPADVHVLVSS